MTSFIPFIKKTILSAGELILKNADKHYKIEEKAKNDFVTEIDKKAENLIIKAIKSNFASHAILGEESSFGEKNNFDRLNNAQYIWLIDPIDGTNNFIRGIDFYCVSVAVFKTAEVKKSKNFQYLKGELVAGAVYAPKLKRLYYAEKNKGAYLNGKKIQVSKIKSLEKSLLSTGFHGKYKMINLDYFKEIIKNSQGIRRMGSAALDLCHVAEGKIEGYWEFGLHPWDIAAGILIVKEAGGRITDTNGNLIDLFGKDILATNGKIHTQITSIFSKIN